MPVFYKYMPSKYVNDFVKNGNVLFRNLSYYINYDKKDGRGDVFDGSVHICPGFPATYNFPEGGRCSIGKDVSITHRMNVNSYYVYCVSRRYDLGLFREFNCDSCVRINDGDLFLRNLRVSIAKLGWKDTSIVSVKDVKYYDPVLTVPIFNPDCDTLVNSKRQCYSRQEESRFVFYHGREESKCNHIFGTSSQAQDNRAGYKSKQKIIHVGSLAAYVDVIRQ